MSHSSRFWDRLAKRYARKPVPDEAVYQEKLRVTREHLRPDSRVLEFGCGTGSTAIAHAPHVREIDAIDSSKKMIEIARGKAEAASVENVAFRQGAIESFEAPDGTFDAVLGLSILHLLADKEAALAKVYRLLKPGGVFVSSTTCLGDTASLFKVIGPVGHFLRLLPLIRVFTGAALRDSLTVAGFEIAHDWQPGPGKALFIVAKKPG